MQKKKEQLQIVKEATFAIIDDDEEGEIPIGLVTGQLDQTRLDLYENRNSARSSLIQPKTPHNEMSILDSETNGQKQNRLIPIMAASAHSPSPKKKKVKLEATINEMLAQVRKIWFDLDDGAGKLELETDLVAFKLCTPQF